MAKILYVEDDNDLAQSVKEWLELNKYLVDLALTAEDAASLLGVNDYDLIIFDRNLPDGDGVSICKSYRQRDGKALILMLTARSTIEEKVEGLYAGADDYLTKPFHAVELLARVRALLRREARPSDALAIDGLELNPVSHSAKVNGKELKLSPQEFALLEFFMRHPGEVFNSDTLLKRVWSGYSEAALDTVRVTINRLRSKMKDKTNVQVKSIYGVGYVLSTEPDAKAVGKKASDDSSDADLDMDARPNTSARINFSPPVAKIDA